MATTLLTKTGKSVNNAMTYEEFLRDYSGQFAEWEDGTIISMSPVTFSHQEISIFLTRLLASYCEETGAGQTLNAPFQMRLSSINRGREPDIAFVLAANASRITPTFLDGPADLIIEIVSPESEVRDRQTKYVEYEQAGVGEYWIIDPTGRTAEFYVRDAMNNRYMPALPDVNGNYESTILPGFWIAVSWLWNIRLPKLRDVLAAWDTGKP